MTAPRPFQLVTLGTLRLLTPEGTEEPSLATRRLKLAVLALLAVSGRPLSRDRLVDLFWGEHPEERAKHSLSDALSHLRRVLGPQAISARQAEVGLAESLPLQVDLRELAAAAAVGDWAGVIARYHGPFLDGVYIGGSADWEHWVHAQRAGAARLFEAACRAEAERLQAAEDWPALAALADRWLAECRDDPLALKARAVAAAKRTSPDPSTGRPIDTVRPDTADGATRSDVPRSDTAAPQPSAPPSSAATRTRWRRPALLAASLIAFAGAAFAIGGGHLPVALMGGTAPTFTLTTRSAEARALVERASGGSDAGISRTEAIALLERAIALDSGFAMAYRTLALLHAGDGTRNAEVAALLTRAASAAEAVTPFERALVLSSYHLLVTGDYARAAAAQRGLIRLAPDDGDAWHDLGMTYQYLGDHARAADAYREALVRDRTSGATWANLIDALVATGDAPATEAALDSMARAIPGHPWVFLATARVRAAQGDFPRAEKEAIAYLAASADTPRRQGIGEYTLARILWAQGRLDEGDDALRRGVGWQVRLGDSTMALRELLTLGAVTAWRRGTPTAAARILDEALTRFPPDARPVEDRPLVELATLQALVGRDAEARRTLATYERLVPAPIRRRSAGSVALAHGTIALAAGDGGAAIPHLRAATTPDCPVCGLPELGLALEARGDTARARDAYRRFLETPTVHRTEQLDALHRDWITARLEAGRPPAWRPTPVRRLSAGR